MTEFQQSYKNRAQAYAKFIQAQGLAVSQSKFFQDCQRLNLVESDKSVKLASLLSYVKEELKIDISSGRSLVERDHDKKLADLDLREKELKVAKLEREGRKDDRDWIHRDTVNEREGALVGQILNEGKYQLSRAVPGLITLCGGDLAREKEVRHQLTEAYYNVFRNLYDSGEIDIAFEDEDEER